MFDGRAFGREIVDQVKAYVERTLKPVEIRMAVLEDRAPPKGDKGDPGQDGLPGRDGADGIGFDDMSFDYDGERTVIVRFVRGDLVKEFPVKLPVPIYRQVYQAERGYERGDMVTFGGSIWHANAETAEKPGDGSGAWTLAAKHGRDGRNGKDGERGPEGRPAKTEEK